MSVESQEALRGFLRRVLSDSEAESVALKTLSEMPPDDRVPVLLELARASSITYSHWERKLRDFTCRK